VRAQTEAERAVGAYRSESQRAIADANMGQVEAQLPLTQQLQTARQRLGALDNVRMDRLDVSDEALIRIPL
jgi:hypothetical protein